MKTLLRHINLQLFAEGGAGGAGDGGGSGEGTGAAPAVSSPASSGNAKNPLANVVYGKPVADAQPAADETAKAPEGKDKDAEFKALIKGDYRDQYGAAVKAAVDARFKSTQEVVDKYNKAAPLFEALGAKYGADASNIDALLKAVSEDDSYFEQEALDRGMSVEQLKAIKNMERENAELRAQMNAQNKRAQADQLYNRWMEEADKTKQIYPNFDLEAELQNQQFANLLQSNIDVQTAYEVIHKDEIIPQAMKFAVQETERKLTNNIAARGKRPAESATSSASSAVVKTDVTKLTAADRREIERRVARGERISF